MKPTKAISERKLNQAIKQLSRGKSPGPDNIPNEQGSCFPLARGHPNGRRASQSHILAGPVGQP